MSTRKPRAGRAPERFEIIPAAAARGQGSASKQASRRVAEALGEVVGDSDTIDDAGHVIAFAFDVRPPNGAPGTALILAGSARLDGHVVLRVSDERALSGMKLGKAIASLPPDQLVADARVEVAVDGATSTVRLTAAPKLAAQLGSTRVLIANVEAKAPAAAGPGKRAPLEEMLKRLLRLRELAAPAILLKNEKQLIQRTYAELIATGWDPEGDPLPEPLRSLCAQVMKPRKSRK